MNTPMFPTNSRCTHLSPRKGNQFVRPHRSTSDANVGMKFTDCRDYHFRFTPCSLGSGCVFLFHRFGFSQWPQYTWFTVRCAHFMPHAFTLSRVCQWWQLARTSLQPSAQPTVPGSYLAPSHHLHTGTSGRPHQATGGPHSHAAGCVISADPAGFASIWESALCHPLATGVPHSPSSGCCTTTGLGGTAAPSEQLGYAQQEWRETLLIRTGGSGRASSSRPPSSTNRLRLWVTAFQRL